MAGIEATPRPWRVALSRYLGIARSLLIYYGKPGRGARERRFFGAFLGPGDLAFDVGAHVGSRTRSWRQLGVRVVAVEPQPDFARLLRWFFGADPGVDVLECALGAREGVATLMLSPATPTVSTLSRRFISQAAALRGFRSVRWTETRQVQVSTLDALIERFGVPVFCKIDVEGFEPEVLAGLSRPLPALSVEYVTGASHAAVQSVRRLSQLACYRFNACRGESMRWALPEWADDTAIIGWLEAEGAESDFGDLYALLPETLQGLEWR